MAISFLRLQLSFEKSSKSSTAISICHVCTLVVAWWSCMNDHFLLFSAGLFSICHIKQCDDLSQLHCLGHRDQAHLTVGGLVQRQSQHFLSEGHIDLRNFLHSICCAFSYILPPYRDHFKLRLFPCGKGFPWFVQLLQWLCAVVLSSCSQLFSCLISLIALFSLQRLMEYWGRFALKVFQTVLSIVGWCSHLFHPGILFS